MHIAYPMDIIHALSKTCKISSHIPPQTQNTPNVPNTSSPTHDLAFPSKVESFLAKLEGELDMLERLDEGNPAKVEYENIDD